MEVDKKSAGSASPGRIGFELAELAIFFATSNFDLKYFCNLLTYKNVQYLIEKIWFISVWNLKTKTVVWVLTGFILGQSTLTSYHAEANGYIFFATSVHWKGKQILSNHLILLKYNLNVQVSSFFVSTRILLEIVNISHTISADRVFY